MRIAGDKRKKGAAGEDAACEFLKKEGYTILWRNYYTDHGEIDIVAEDDTHIIFAEVKTRADDPEMLRRFGRPATAVNIKKREHIIYSARLYLARHPSKKTPRFDIIEVYEGEGEERRIKHLTGAFIIKK